MMSRTQFGHSLGFFLMCFAVAFAPGLSHQPFWMFCFVMIATLGISHGALDHVKGREVLTVLNRESMWEFYLLYLTLAALVVGVWSLSPALTMFAFLLLASFHFGKEDLGGLVPQSSSLGPVLLLLKGGAIIFAPLYFHVGETAELFGYLGFHEISIVPREWWLVGLCLSFIANATVGFGVGRQSALMLLLEFSAVVALNVSLHPMLAFALYFCFLHSLRHMLSGMTRLGASATSDKREILQILVCLTFVVALILTFIFKQLSGWYSIQEASSRVLFIGLAALTFPHFVLEIIHEHIVEGSPEFQARDLGEGRSEGLVNGSNELGTMGTQYVSSESGGVQG